MASKELVGYFGYGSLVNRDTLRTAYVGAVRAELRGWRREWGLQSALSLRKTCGLTVSPDPAGAIQGLLVIDTLENLPQVDARENHYDRVALAAADLDCEEAPGIEAIYVYSAKPAHRGRGNPDHPILQSYLDAVLQGYAREFGEAGLRRFVAETVGWEQPILADREQPIYPRAVTLSEAERALFDALVSQCRTARLPGAVGC